MASTNLHESGNRKWATPPRARDLGDGVCVTYEWDSVEVTLFADGPSPLIRLLTQATDALRALEAVAQEESTR
jgi:hypothetical protein